MNRIALLGLVALLGSSIPALASDNGPTPQGTPGQTKPGDQKPGDQKPGDQDKPKQEEPGQTGPGKQHEPDGTNRLVPFNLVCYYEKEHKEGDDRHEKRCKVAAVFLKAVTVDGGEVRDESPSEPGAQASPLSPQMQVECEGEVKFQTGGRRFTDLLSTRIQGLTGPTPAIHLPRGTLHAGNHVSDSYLEIDTKWDDERRVRLPGQCYIWTGQP